MQDIDCRFSCRFQTRSKYKSSIRTSLGHALWRLAERARLGCHVLSGASKINQMMSYTSKKRSLDSVEGARPINLHCTIIF